MPITPSFTVQQSSANWTNLVYTDTSTGSDPDIVVRHLYIQKANGAYLSTESTDYMVWAIADLTKDVNGLITQDYSLLMTVEWLDAMGGDLYTKVNLYYLGTYNSNSLYGIVQAATANPRVQFDMNYWSNLGVAFCEKQNAEFATEYYQQVKSQAAINRLTNLLSQPIINF
jgi:hypothetical protein